MQVIPSSFLILAALMSRSWASFSVFNSHSSLRSFIFRVTTSTSAYKKLKEIVIAPKNIFFHFSLNVGSRKNAHIPPDSESQMIKGHNKNNNLIVFIDLVLDDKHVPGLLQLLNSLSVGGLQML